MFIVRGTKKQTKERKTHKKKIFQQLKDALDGRELTNTLSVQLTTRSYSRQTPTFHTFACDNNIGMRLNLTEDTQCKVYSDDLVPLATRNEDVQKLF